MTDWRETHADIRRLKSVYRRCLKGARGGASAVEEYLASGEPAMALESLCLDLMGHPAVRNSDLKELDRLVKLLGLDCESVFDPDFGESWNAMLRRRCVAP